MMSRVKEGNDRKELSAAAGATMGGPHICGPERCLGGGLGWERAGQGMAWHEGGHLGGRYMQNFRARIRILFQM